jgi:hypothetical protein
MDTLKNLKNKCLKKIEGFKTEIIEMSPASQLISLVWMFVFFYAIFLSFKCNNGQFKLLDFIVAFFFAPLYIAYKLGTSWDVCMK